jgi:hypothetical protein
VIRQHCVLALQLEYIVEYSAAPAVLVNTLLMLEFDNMKIDIRIING